VGAIHYDTDETGDAHQFCVGLAERARQEGVKFRFCSEVRGLELRSGRIAAVVSGRERFVAEKYIIASGSYSTLLLRHVGVYLPVRPVKGYSITLVGGGATAALRIPVVDDDLHTAIVPFGNALRVAGTAEFAGYDLTLSPGRIRNLLTLLREVLPQERFDATLAKPWCGLRATSADGVPIIGATGIIRFIREYRARSSGMDHGGGIRKAARRYYVRRASGC